jgi:hypothetical protein
MAAKNDFSAIFEQLRAILKKFEKRLLVQTDKPGNYYLNTPFQRADGYRIFFGAVQIKKNYVSFHLMPVYGCLDLLDDMSPELKARMQGKSCFNFKTLQPKLTKELAQLTKKGFERFKKAGYI